MAKVILNGDQLELQLSLWEKIGALHTSPKAAKSSLKKIEFVEQLWGAQTLRGIRAPGTALPYVVLLGTLRGRGYKDFVAMKGRSRGCILTFAEGPFERWIFTLRQPESELTGLLSAPSEE
ncbi:MAG: hypothetical protein ACO20U_06470 [Candidatus Planktophila sp.]